MLTGARLTLREWREKDLPAIAALRNNIELQSQLMAQARPNSISRVRDWLVDRTSREDMVFLVIASNGEDAVQGYVQVAKLDRHNGTGELGICLAPDAQGKNLAEECCQLLEHYLHATFALRKLTLHVLATNARATRFYLKMGYREVGRLEQHFLTDAQYQDVLLMERFLVP